ncbi:glycosyltransferase family 2 protein [Chryseobacterium sp. MP_3.2]|uniref:glycosyltransferase family 2 protein n=1 Tax=Chryseobacterium sp. MP_3.2 TaxID=3071712 RepID=UPI002DFFCF85|nr:N-acetylglucosaminyl-diphospho-decaprenol L-rhamnosyltransferase [Chryseobacterium sp. MP_3.2]
MTLSIIIVNFNVTDLLRNCILSIDKFVKDISYEIIVVDNNSPDSSWKILIKEFPKVKFIAAETNRGFSVANNRGAQHATGSYLLLLNPDTKFESYNFNEIIDFVADMKDFGCLGVRMHNGNGSFLPESKRSIPDMFNSFEKLFLSFRKNTFKSYYRNDINEFSVAPVDVVTGAFLLIKTDVYRKIGGLDEQYFMYGEDIDLCYTLIQNHYKNWYYGNLSIVHFKGESTIKNSEYLKRFYGAMQIFIEKYYKEKYPIQYIILSIGLKVRFVIEQIKLNF